MSAQLRKIEKPSYQHKFPAGWAATARCESVMTTQAEFHFSWVYTFSATPRSLRIWATHHRERPVATQHPLRNCVDHLAAPSHTCATWRVETGQQQS